MLFKSKKLIAALVTLGLFAFLLFAWTKLSKRYSTSTLPESFEVLTFLEQNNFFELPNFVLYDLEGEEVDLRIFPQDKVYILSFWASWCEPCAEEFPSMVKLVQQYPEEVVILAVSNDSEKKDIKTFAKAFDLDSQPNIKLFWDKDKKLADLLKVDRLPESFVFNQQGQLVKKVIGSRDWAAPDAIGFFKSLTQSSSN